jgi:NAD(P)-dependent dehydrogenase (short-subunit alcohol dehydrogenase family)/rRNA maturation endonuclease Nob1
MDFTQQEWDNCIKVLKILAKEPNKGLDINTLKGLVTKIHKQAKKENKAKVLENKAEPLINSVENLSNEKIKKLIKTQDIYRQYDQSLKENTLLFKNYQLPLIAAQIAEKNAENNAENNSENGVNNETIYAKKCYICKTPYTKIHFFYHTICPECAALNYEKRKQSCDLTGRVALITGGRIKIGYLTALQMLRDGAKVWVTTRFAKDCAKRFSEETDFNNWSDRLHIVALDLRHLKALQDFLNYLLIHETHLDIIINNAAQTIKRPPEFYAHLFDFEQQNKAKLSADLQKILPFDAPFQFLKSEQKLLPSEAETYFPKGIFDKDNQQIDQRTENSWSLLLEDVSPMEMIETQLVSVTAPFMINSTLKPLFSQSPFERKFIINVSAMEGQFNRSSKTPFHPHTNMAKAALNMMTRTSAQEYGLHNIFMNSVDTGWITQENPFPKKERLFNEEGFVPPLDEIDGMARIYDPIVSGINKPEMPLLGHFLKDYKPYFW